MAKKNKTAPRLDKRALFALVGFEPHPGQVLVHRSTAKRRVLCCGARWGKSTCAVMEAVAALLEPNKGSIGWTVAPTFDLSARIFDRVAAVMQQHFAPHVKVFSPRERKLVVINLGGGKSEMVAKSSDNPVSLLGEGLDWLVIDEAAQIKAAVWDECLSARLVDKRGWCVMLSTPKGAQNWFYEMFRRGRNDRDPDYESWQSPSWDNPHLDRAVIEAERARLPEEAFQETYEAVFLHEERVPCEVCGGPSPDVIGSVYVQLGETVPRCAKCGQLTDERGRTLLRLLPDGRIARPVVMVLSKKLRSSAPPDSVESDLPASTG